MGGVGEGGTASAAKSTRPVPLRGAAFCLALLRVIMQGVA